MRSQSVRCVPERGSCQTRVVRVNAEKSRSKKSDSVVFVVPHSLSTKALLHSKGHITGMGFSNGSIVVFRGRNFLHPGHLPYVHDHSETPNAEKLCSKSVRVVPKRGSCQTQVVPSPGLTVGVSGGHQKLWQALQAHFVSRTANGLQLEMR